MLRCCFSWCLFSSKDGSRPKTVMLTEHTLHSTCGWCMTGTYTVQLTHTLHIQLTYILQQALASVAALSTRAGDCGSCYVQCSHTIQCIHMHIKGALTFDTYLTASICIGSGSIGGGAIGLCVR